MLLKLINMRTEAIYLLCIKLNIFNKLFRISKKCRTKYTKKYEVLAILLYILRLNTYWLVHKLPQIYTANQATFPIQMRKISVQICGNFRVTQEFMPATPCVELKLKDHEIEEGL